MSEEVKKEINIDEITAKVKADLEAKAEVQVKADAEAKEKNDKMREEIRVEEQAKLKIEADEKIEKEAKTKSFKTSKKKDEQSEEIYAAMVEDRTKTFDYEMDVNGTEELIKESAKADIDGNTSYGAEFVPEEYAAGFYFRMGSMHGNLMNLFPKRGMKHNTLNIAELLTKPTISAYSSIVNQNTAVENVTATDVTTAQKQLTARKFVAKVKVYDQTLADEGFGLMKGIKRALSEEIATSVSSAILNGDTTTTHMDEDYEAAGANIPEAMWKGLRKLTLAGSLGVDGSTTYTLADLDKLKKLMGKYAIGSNLRKCKWIMGVKTYNELMGLWRASTSTPQAADFIVKNGYIQSYMGHDVIVSDKQREDLEIDGYYDESGTAASEGFTSLVNTDQFLLGIRDNMQIKVVPDPLNDRRVVQATLRMDFQPFEAPSTTIASCAGLYAYTLS